MSSPSFSLKKPQANLSLFKPTDAALSGTSETVVKIGVEKLHHYRNHPFKLYEGERLNDMVDSIKTNGIMIPLLVRPLPDGEYEILAGHNRFEGAKITDLTEVPCIIKEGLSEEEAHLIVTESNLIQRSFTDLSHSERAAALSAHYNAIKHQGKRTDLIRQVEAILSGENGTGDSENADAETCTPAGNKSIGVTGEKYGLSKNSVARYIRVNSLISEFKEFLDSEELSFRAGVTLSYLDEQRQQDILSQSQRHDVIPSMKQAEQIRQLAADTPDDSDNDKFLEGCTDILLGRNDYEKAVKPKKTINFKLERTVVESYFNENDTGEAIQEKVLEALEFYHRFYEKHKNKTGEIQ